jgi:putative salt-induced outer membrane protein YdiY
MRKNYLLLTGLLVVSSSVFAHDEPAAPAEPTSPWKGSAEVGVVRTTGNTETQNTSLKGDVIYEDGQWKYTGHGEAFGASQEDENGDNDVSAERYLLSGKADYKMSDVDYVFGLVQLQKDRFSGFEYEHVVSAGYGRKVIKEADMELDVEIGPGVRFFKVDGGEADEEALLRLAGKYWWAITDHSKFTQDLTVEIGEDLTTTTSVTGLQASVSDSLAMKLTFTVKNKNEVPAGTEKTDTETALTLVYAF